MNQIAVFPLKDRDFETQIYSLKTLDNKYYTAPLEYTRIHSNLEINSNIQAVILDDIHVSTLIDPSLTIIYINSGDSSIDDSENTNVITVNPQDPNALLELVNILQVIDWPEKTLKSISKDPLDLFERLLEFKTESGFSQKAQDFALLLDEMLNQ